MVETQTIMFNETNYGSAELREVDWKRSQLRDSRNVLLFNFFKYIDN